MKATHYIAEVQPTRMILACGIKGPYPATTIPRRVDCLNLADDANLRLGLVPVWPNAPAAFLRP